MRVCHVITSLALGGAEKQLLRFISNDSSKTKHTVCFLGYDDSLADDFKNVGAEVHSLGGSSKFDSPFVLYKLIRYIRRENFDIIHNHQLYAMIFGRIASVVTGTNPVVSTHQNSCDNYGKVFKRLERLTRHIDTVTVAVSEGVKQSFALGNDAPSGNWCVVYNSIDIDEFRTSVQSSANQVKILRDKYGIDPHDFVFLNVGRYVKQKNQHRLIEAMQPIVAKHPNCKLLIVGWGKLHDTLEKRVQELNLGENIFITGRADPIHEYYFLADAFVLSSHFEGLSIASVEALAAGLPMIGTDVSGINEVIEHGQNGYLVEPNSTVDLSEAMIKLLETNQLEKFEKEAFLIAEQRFSIESTVKSYIKLYNKYL